MEFRKMRRGRQELSFEETEAILNRRTAGVLALSGDEGYPYAVPISYVYVDGHFLIFNHLFDRTEVHSFGGWKCGLT